MTASEELDALVMALTEKCQRENTYDALYDDAADAITTLRAQLAEALAVNEELQAAVAIAEDYANRAEAERAAQIEVDAGIASFRHDENEIMRATWATPKLTTIEDVAEEIRNQPHDRTALESAIRAAKVEAWKEAADLCQSDGLGYKDDILALIGEATP